MTCTRGLGKGKAEKINKWKGLQQVSEREMSKARDLLVEALANKIKLKRKDTVLSAIAEGTSVIFGFMGLLRSDAPQDRLLELELGIQLLQQQADAAGGFLQGPDANVDEIMALGLATADGPAEEQFSTKLIREWFEPTWVAQVLAMSDAGIAARLKQLVGESAVLTVQLRLANTLPTASSESRSNNLAMRPAPPTAGIEGINNNQVEAPWPLPAAAADRATPMLEYAGILTTLMLWDEDRYRRIQNMNLDSLEPADSAPQEYWSSIADCLELSQDQAGMLGICQDRRDARTQPLMQRINVTAATGLRVAQMQEREQQQEDKPVLPQRPQLLHAQARVQQRFESLLKQWQLLEVEMDLVSLNTLSLEQLGMLQVLSFPRCPRIEMVIRGTVRPNDA
ncbi:hypothetical protein OEZ86_002098 [Tetradesmus obliquus]|nr:hypothetical protein OEZ86_002098 [Tetradesmus obliquus]